MHPEIKKFWQDAGHTLIGPSIIQSWEIHIGKGPVRRVEIVCHGNKHRWNNKWYSEEEMLKIIKLKAFL